MEKVYLVCAIIGGTLWVGQFVLSLMGGGDMHDAGGDHGGGDHGSHDAAHGGHDGAIAWLVSVLTLRTLTAGVVFFGLGGLASTYSNHSKLVAGQIAVASGLLAILLVAGVMKLLNRLRDDGTVHIDGAVGKVGTVYLTIPPHKTGRGKIQLKLQERTVEYQAVSPAGELPTGSPVVVVAVVGPDLLEVLPART